MSDIKDNGYPAFPVTAGNQVYATGISVRDWFAGMALQGCLSYSHNNESWGDFHNNSTKDETAKHCYEYADAMLKARE